MMEITWRIFDLDIEDVTLDDPRVQSLVRKFKVLEFIGIIYELQVRQTCPTRVHIFIKCWKPFRKIVFRTLLKG